MSSEEEILENSPLDHTSACTIAHFFAVNEPIPPPEQYLQHNL